MAVPQELSGITIVGIPPFGNSQDGRSTRKIICCRIAILAVTDTS
ncbi:hypothetical protein QUB28_12105 [Microcoleus sp. B4-C3]